MIRRPSGVTGWMTRVQNGLLTNRPPAEGEVGLGDITDLLLPSLPPTPKSR